MYVPAPKCSLALSTSCFLMYVTTIIAFTSTMFSSPGCSITSCNNFSACINNINIHHIITTYPQEHNSINYLFNVILIQSKSSSHTYFIHFAELFLFSVLGNCSLNSIPEESSTKHNTLQNNNTSFKQSHIFQNNNASSRNNASFKTTNSFTKKKTDQSPASLHFSISSSIRLVKLISNTHSKRQKLFP